MDTTETTTPKPANTTVTITRKNGLWEATIPGSPPERASSLADVLVKVYTAVAGGALEVQMPYRAEVGQIMGHLADARKSQQLAANGLEALTARMVESGVTQADQRRILSPIKRGRP